MNKEESELEDELFNGHKFNSNLDEGVEQSKYTFTLPSVINFSNDQVFHF